MPNWCEGTLKVRGKMNDVKRFFLEGIKCYDVNYKDFSQTVDESAIKLDYDGEEEVGISINKVAHILGTTRAFIDPTEIYLLLRKGGITVATVNVRQTWDMVSSEFFEISKKYGIDMRLYGFERGMEFNREIIIEKDKIIKDDVIEFDDYDWECIMPNLGG